LFSVALAVSFAAAEVVIAAAAAAAAIARDDLLHMRIGSAEKRASASAARTDGESEEEAFLFLKKGKCKT